MSESCRSALDRSFCLGEYLRNIPSARAMQTIPRTPATTE